jgi:hypothetical protein
MPTKHPAYLVMPTNHAVCIVMPTKHPVCLVMHTKHPICLVMPTKHRTTTICANSSLPVSPFFDTQASLACFKAASNVTFVSDVTAAICCVTLSWPFCGILNT